MAAYLDEETFGRDDYTIGYPHLVFCNGITIVTEMCLFGVHCSRLGDAAQVYHAFLFVCEERGLRRGNPMAVCSAVNVWARYGADCDEGWRQEMIQFAGIVRYRGQVNEFNISVIPPRDGTYVEVRRDWGIRTPFRTMYKRDEKTVLGLRNTVPSIGNADVVAYDVTCI
jgi:hypothetical protein